MCIPKIDKFKFQTTMVAQKHLNCDFQFSEETNSLERTVYSNGFDPDQGCPVLGTGRVSDIECCGHYPDRFPYKVVNGQRACCLDKTYAVDIMQCCDDNTVHFLCDS